MIFAEQSPPLSAEAIAQVARQIRSADAEAVLLPILVQLVAIILAARLFGLMARRFHQPAAVGELIAGLLLGPSFLARFWPEGHAWLFHPAIHGTPAEIQPLLDAMLHWIFTVLSQIGLVLLLFLVGLEFDFSHLKLSGKSALAISLAGIILPFGLGAALAPLLLPYLEVHPLTGEAAPQLGFTLFMGAAMSITALPMLGRIMMEMGITTTRIGTIAISAAAVNDAVGWILLASVAAIVRGSFEPYAIGLMVAATLGYTLLLLVVLGPWLRRWARSTISSTGEVGTTGLAILLVLVLASSVVTNLIGIFAIFGAFLLGAVLSPEVKFREAVGRRLQDVVSVFFLPIFFTYTGLRTRIDALDGLTMWALCGVVLAAAVLGKFGGCSLAARLTGFSPRESVCIGAMMNTRGLMELIVVNLGYELGVIPPSVFCMLVIMALTTTIMTTPLLLRFMHGTEIEAGVRQSGFLRVPASV